MSNNDENTKHLTPEQEEEQKFKNKYPNSMKPGGSNFVQKMLHRGNKKYFDSGDYNMAKSKNKLLAAPSASIPTIVSPSIPNNQTPSNFSSISQTPSTPSSTKQQQQNNSIFSNDNSINTTTTTTKNSNLNSINNELTKNSIENLSSPTISYSSPTITNNISTTTTTTNSLNLNDNISTDNLLIDDDIIGHEIPTPECLPRKHSNIQSKLVTNTTTS